MKIPNSVQWIIPIPGHGAVSHNQWGEVVLCMSQGLEDSGVFHLAWFGHAVENLREQDPGDEPRLGLIGCGRYPTSVGIAMKGMGPGSETWV